MENQSEYYLITRTNNAKYPLLIEDDGCPFYIKEQQYIENPERMFFCLGTPIPRKPEMVDYHPVPYTVMSKKLYDVLAPLNIEGIQLIPATITSKNNELFEEYYYLHIYNIFPVLDKELSKYEWSDFMKRANFIDKFVLNKKSLQSIPLEERLIFKLAENTSFELYHESIVNKIMEINPEGLHFINISDWSNSSLFE